MRILCPGLGSSSHSQQTFRAPTGYTIPALPNLPSQEHKAHLRGFELLCDAPVVQIVPQPPVADAKLEVLEELGVLKDVQRIEDVMAPAQRTCSCRWPGLIPAGSRLTKTLPL